MNDKARERQRRAVAKAREISPGDLCRAYRALAASEDGAIVLADLVRRFGFTRRSTFEQDDPQGRKQAFNEGQRAVLTHIGYMQDVDPAAYEQSTQPKGQQ